MRTRIESNQRGNRELLSGSFNWFDNPVILLKGHAIPAVERLILAWLDGQPEVSESELFTLGKLSDYDGDFTKWDKLWDNGHIESPEYNMKSILQPGSTPGTWRMKEPPEGAVQP